MILNLTGRKLLYIQSKSSAKLDMKILRRSYPNWPYLKEKNVTNLKKI